MTDTIDTETGEVIEKPKKKKKRTARRNPVRSICSQNSKEQVVRSVTTSVKTLQRFY